MTPNRVTDWLLDRAVGRDDVAESIRGDLLAEAQRYPRAIRGAWYAWQAVRIAAGFLAGRVLGRAPRRPAPAARTPISVVHGLRNGLRVCRRRPGFTVLAVATLGLGIGATTAIVSVVDRVMLRALPYPDPHELVTVWNTYPGWRGHEVLDPLWDEIHLSYPEYRDWRDGQTVFRSVGIYTTGPATLTGVGDPVLIGFGAASATLFPMLGARPHLGRFFTGAEEGAGGARVAVVSHRFWMGRLGGVFDAAGRAVTVDGERYEVIGVLPAGFRVRSLTGLTTETPDVWVPAGLFGDADDRGWHHYEGIARLGPGVTLTRAVADAGPLLRGGADPSRRGVRILPRQREEVAAARGPLMVLLLAATLLLAIAGVNVATLFTAEASKRRHEFATRRALGATRGQLTRQLTVECGTLGLLGAAAGVGVAVVAIPALLSLAPPEMGLPARIPVDVRILAAAAAFGVLVGITFGVVPSLLVTRTGSGTLFSARSVTTHRTAARLQRALIATEAALAIVLLVGAGLLGRTLLAMEAVNPGFRREQIVAASVPLSGPRTQPDAVIQLARDLTARLRGLPGVVAVTGANAVPFSGEGGSSSFRIEGRAYDEREKLPEAHRRAVLPGFHEMLGIPVVAGRGFRPEDREGSHPVVIISQSLAQRYWPDESPLGAIIVRDQQRWEIVGVVGDILHGGLTERRQSTFYFPFFQQPPNRFWMLVRTALPTETLDRSLRAAVAEMAPDVAVGTVEALSRMVDQSAAAARYRAVLVAVFGSCSLLLAAVGIFGITARMVTARRRELGIRLVLGARPAAITRAVMRTEAWAVGLGIVVGLVLAAFAVRVLESVLFGVSALDPRTFAAAGAMLAVVGLAASYLPARTMTTANPLDVLRAE